ncbi:uncharacterized protein DNG_01076 [Cephalotrichum gorgonifer]|uniref:Uncharacterized protein n=1 Tax=Cephalotrichum gorgonifer TaxID=2041049 RepID=A0AAE8MPV2_9PEZI|nr:uncharacterized protein DNG_01076 [Cephalotrichum gorgonifer]
MRFGRSLGLAGCLLAGHGLATGDYCPNDAVSVFGSNVGASCCGSVVIRGLRRSLLPRWADEAPPPTCDPRTTQPPCCTTKEQGPPEVSSGGSTNLQCGKKYEPDTSSHDVPSAVTYAIADCQEDPTQKCLHAQVSASADATITDIHLNIGTGSLPSTALGRWPFNKYCTFSGQVGDCWVPISAIEALLTPPSLCGATVKVAFGISVSYSGGGSDTCFGQGSPLDGKNWFMYSLLSFACPDVCTGWCCCKPPPVVEPPKPPVACEFGSAYGYGPNYSNFNGNPNPPALADNTCKKWGFYFAVSDPTLSGILHAGAGQNDLSKGAAVGAFSAMLVGTNLVVSYSLDAGYDLSEVHVYASCTVPRSCSPGSYTYTGNGLDLSGTEDRTFSKSIAIAGSPPCSTYYLIFHAKVNKLYPYGTTCPASND